MKIQVTSGDHNIKLRFPTALIFSPVVARLGYYYSNRYTENVVQGITLKDLNALFAEFRRIKREYGSWELVDVESSNGDHVKVVL